MNTIYDAYSIISMEFHKSISQYKKQLRERMTNLHPSYDLMSINLICIFCEFLKASFRLSYSAEIRRRGLLSLDITLFGIIGMRVSIIVFLLLCTFCHSSLGNLLNMDSFYHVLMNQHLLNPYW